MLAYGFAGSETAGNRRGPALGNGEKGVINPLPGKERNLWLELLLGRAGYPDRPPGQHGHGDFLVSGVYLGDGIFHPERSLLNSRDRARYPGRNEHPVGHELGFRNGPEDVPGYCRFPDFHAGSEFPDAVPVEGGHRYSRGYEIADRIPDLFQRTLDPVEEAPQDARPQFHREGSAGAGYLFPGGEPGGILINLEVGQVSVELDGFSHEMLGTDADHLVHLAAAHSLGNDQGAGNVADDSFRVLRQLIFLLTY